MAEPAIAFSVRNREAPALEVQVNFGVFAGRDVTPAEIHELARKLASAVTEFTIVAERRHEFSGAAEASLHSVRIEVASTAIADDEGALRDRILATAESWAHDCIADRHAEI